MSTSHHSFDQEYARLNPEQKTAVDTIEGPVMVIAGAGTGKTQTIALRIANILLKTQTPPNAILCLTFTDNAAANMRQRLITIIGARAYSLKIHTFHSFCNEVITTNPEYFIIAPDLKPLDELEKIDIIQKLIDTLPDSSILKPWGDHYYYQSEIISLLQTVKRENQSPEMLIKLINDQHYFVSQSATFITKLRGLRASKTLESEVLSILDQLISIPHLSPSIKALLGLDRQLYTSGTFTSGKAKNPAINLKNELLKRYDDFTRLIPKQLEFTKIYTKYQQELIAKSRYDFDDMILFVIEAFQKNPELLLRYQEQFQYLLVDEYQDTNASQNTIIDQLGSYFADPNTFVVGDDDQSIFRFQGAAIENMFDFYEKHKKTLKIIVLKNNYRSHQLILDTSQSIINRNKNRIATYIENIDKSLTALQTYDPNPINLYVANTSLDENYYVAQKITSLLNQGTSPSQIAVLFRANKDSLDLIEMLTRLGVKYYQDSGDNILENQVIKQLLTVFQLINNPFDDQLIFRVLSFPFTNINIVDLFRILRATYQQKVSLGSLVNNPSKLTALSPALKPQTLVKIRNFNRRLAKAIISKEIDPLPVFFNKTIRLFKYLKYILKSNCLRDLSDLNQLYAEIKRLAQEPGTNLTTLLNRFELMDNNHLTLVSDQSILNDQSAVRLLTVHKAKGLEFEYVFLIKVLDKKWGNTTNSNALPLPLGILKNEMFKVIADDDSDNEEERRLFYVALTRAKKQIYISYASHNAANKEQFPSQFIAEIEPRHIEKIPTLSINSQIALTTLFPLSEPKQHKSDELQEYLTRYLQTNYKLSVTHLNSYLKCPRCFYFQTILRLPQVKNKFAALGTAIHFSLSSLFNHLKTNPQYSLSNMITAFTHALKNENLNNADFQETLTHGQQILTAYYQHYKNEFNGNYIIDFDFNKDNVSINDVPVTGKIDKIDIGKFATVIDFKTGNPDSKFAQLKPDGDYVRQLIFYKLLAEHDPNFKYQVKQGIIDFIEVSKRTKNFVRKIYDFKSEDEQLVTTQITDVYRHILNLDFEPNPDCQDPLHLHSLTI